MQNLLEIRNLEKRYEGFSLEGISLDVPQGCVVGLVGSNGSGKTTTIKAALDLIRIDGGSVSLLGEQLNDLPERRKAEIRRQVGVVMDTCAFPEELACKRIGHLFGNLYPTWNENEFLSLLKRFDVPAEKRVKSLSRGMGMKLSLACALAARPRLLLLDEATAGLDPLARDQALDALRNFMGDNTRGILMSSHITSDLEKIADYIVCIDEGRMVFSLEKDAITDTAGVALCRADEFEAVTQSGLFARETLRFERTPYATRLLVPDRFALAENFPHVTVERSDIDTFMSLMLKGETL